MGHPGFRCPNMFRSGDVYEWEFLDWNSFEEPDGFVDRARGVCADDVVGCGVQAFARIGSVGESCGGQSRPIADRGAGPRGAVFGGHQDWIGAEWTAEIGER